MGTGIRAEVPMRKNTKKDSAKVWAQDNKIAKNWGKDATPKAK